jgi:Lar family restriction alleviation protein
MIRELPASCPFCGSLSTPPDLDGDDGSWVVVCPECGGSGPPRADKDEAITAWNHRVIVLPSPEAFGETQ